MLRMTPWNTIKPVFLVFLSKYFLFRVLLSAVQYSHVLLQESSEWVPAMDWARDIAEDSNITGEFNLGQISPAFAIAPRLVLSL